LDTPFIRAQELFLILQLHVDSKLMELDNFMPLLPTPNGEISQQRLKSEMPGSLTEDKNTRPIIFLTLFLHLLISTMMRVLLLRMMMKIRPSSQENGTDIMLKVAKKATWTLG